MSAGPSRAHAMRTAIVFALVAPVALVTACRGVDPVGPGESARFADGSWDDGMAAVSVYEGRVRRYGVWREARVSDYLVRESLDPDELTKRDAAAPGLVPVLKANRLMEFTTGSYDYRLMSTLFFRRGDGALYKGAGTCVNACGLVFQRWDAPSGMLRSDSYWEGEGRAESSLPAGDWRFADELPFVAHALADGTRIRVRPPLASPRSILQRPGPEGAPEAWLGIGDLCTECMLGGEPNAAGAWSAAALGAAEVSERTLVVEREGERVRLVGEDGTVELELALDARGFVESWTLRGEQEFRRVATFRGPYWERVAPGDRALVAR